VTALRLIAAATVATGIIALSGCGSSAGPQRLSPACGTALSVSHYVTGHNGTMDAPNDFLAISRLSAAKWHTAAEKAAAARVIRDLNPDITVQGYVPNGIPGGAESIAEGPQLLAATSALLSACQASPVH
jgi:hypothetical protein